MAPRRGRVRRGRQGLLTILFTDLEGSTAMTQRLGDARAQEIVRAHNTIVRREVSARGGTDVKHTGDGIMATFPSAARAVAAAVAMQEASRAYNDTHPETAFNIAVGLNAGEPVAEDADVFGSAVQMAARACAQAHGGQILATNVVRELVYGKGAVFADIGSSELKGFAELVHLFEVSAGAGGIDEGEQRASNRVPLFAAIGAVVAVIAVGAGVLVFALSGEEEVNDSEPSYNEIHISSNEAASNPDPSSVTGDCVTAPLAFKGRFETAFTGDISGTISAPYEATTSLADQCEGVALSGVATTSANGGNTSIATFRALSVNLLSSGTVGVAEFILAAVTTGGTGVYEDVSGRSVCHFLTVTDTQNIQGASSTVECIIKLAPRSSLPPIIFQPIANAEKVTTQLAPSSRPDTFKILLLYFNTRDEPQSGLSARLPVPSGAQISSSAEGDSMVEGAREWELPDLGPGEVASFEITVRLLSAEGATVTLLPEIAVQGRKRAFTSDPVVIAVEQ